MELSVTEGRLPAWHVPFLRKLGEKMKKMVMKI